VQYNVTPLGTVEYIPAVEDAADEGAFHFGYGDDPIVSADGSTVVFKQGRWTRDFGIQYLGVLPGFKYTRATEVSADGNVVVGFSFDDSEDAEAFIWTPARGIRALEGSFFSFHTIPVGVSASGDVIIGDTLYFDFGTGAHSDIFRWTASAGMQLLGLESALCGGYAVSSDANILVGAYFSGPSLEACRLTTSGIVQPLGFIPGDTDSSSSAVNADGSVIVGSSWRDPSFFTTSEAFRWTQSGGMQGIGILPGNQYSEATAVSPDGDIVVGTSDGGNFPARAFRWTAIDGITPLKEQHGIQVNAPNWELLSASSVGTSGSILGFGTYSPPHAPPSGWIQMLLLTPVLKPDIVAKSLAYDNIGDGVNFTFEVKNADPPRTTTASLYWATGNTFADHLGGAVFTTPVPPFKGQYPPIHVSVAALGAPPSSATRLILVTDPDNLVDESDENNNIQALRLTDISVTSLNWNVDQGGVDLTYRISRSALDQSADASFYWANGTGVSDILGSAIFTVPLSPPVGDYGPIHISAGTLVSPPPGATSVLAVLDPSSNGAPKGRIIEVNEYDNTGSVRLPDLIAVPNSFGVAPDKFFWNPLSKGGGFTFTYEIVNPSLAPIPDTTISFDWAFSIGSFEFETVAKTYTFTIADADTDSAGAPLKAEGQHTITLAQSQLVQFSAQSGTNPSPTSNSTHLLMTVDPTDPFHDSGTVLESNENNNKQGLKTVALVVNIISHGANPNLPKSEFLPNFDQLKQVLDVLPARGSTLDGRVSSYRADWDSTSFFYDGFKALLVSKLAFAESVLSFLTDPELSSGLLATSAASYSIAAATSLISDIYLKLAAQQVLEDITLPGANYLLPYDQSNVLQRIELIGHSRGAGLNAILANQLWNMGYRNIDYISLDGYADDWPDGSGVLSNVDIVHETSVLNGEKINYRASGPRGEDQGMEYDPAILKRLNDIIHGALPAGLAYVQAHNHMRAPVRAGFADGGFFDILGSAHTTITPLYCNAVESHKSGYFDRLYLGAHWADGLGSPPSPLPASICVSSSPSMPQVDEPTPADTDPGRPDLGEGLPPSAAPAIPSGFADGNIESLGALDDQIRNLDFSPTGDAYLDDWLQYLADPLNTIGVYWDTTGDVRLARTAGNASLELHQGSAEDASVSQPVFLPAGSRSVAFDLGILAAAPGDILEVSLNGTVLASTDLANLHGTNHLSVSLNGAPPDGGTFTFRLRGLQGTSASVQLDNFTVVAGALAILAADGTLVINGTAANDSFTLTSTGGSISWISDSFVGPLVFPATGVKSIIVSSGGGNDTLNVNGGTFSFNTDIGIAAPNLAIFVNGGGSLNFVASQHLGSLTLTGGAKAALLANGSRFIRAGSVFIATTATLDLADNGLILPSTAANRFANLSTLSALIKSGRRTGDWNGPGLTSSAAAGRANHVAGLAAMLNDKGNGSPLYPTFDGEPVDANSILVKYTYNGDADLSGKIDADDYFRIDNGFALKLAGYRNGDFDFNDVVDADDYFLIDRAFAGQTGVLAGPSPQPSPARRGSNSVRPAGLLSKHGRGRHHRAGRLVGGTQ
jgi:uncharacterized membrane protein